MNLRGRWDLTALQAGDPQAVDYREAIRPPLDATEEPVTGIRSLVRVDEETGRVFARWADPADVRAALDTWEALHAGRTVDVTPDHLPGGGAA